MNIVGASVEVECDGISASFTMVVLKTVVYSVTGTAELRKVLTQRNDGHFDKH